MRRKFPLVLLFALLAGSAAYAAGPQPVAMYTFICNGNAFFEIGPCPEGGRPDSLIQGSDGNFYGVAQLSAEGDSAPNGGTVFSLTPKGAFTLLHTFAPGTNKNYPNGNLPGGLLEGPDGKLYGETSYGGVDGCNGACGFGVLYRVNRNGSGFQVIHKFCSQTNCADGSFGGLAGVGSDGNVYGYSYSGGTCNCGAIFRVTPSNGAYAVAYNFDGITSEFPQSFTPAADGTFYGVDYGTSQGLFSHMLYHFVPATSAFTSSALNFPFFNGLPSIPNYGLTLGPNGNFYGLYQIYGSSGLGLYEVQPDGSNLQLFAFYNTIDGGGAPQTMLLASDGNFWVPDLNGSTGYGDIISLSPTDGTLLQTFAPFTSSAAVGAFPLDLVQAKDGTLWGSTEAYGKYTKGHFAAGVVFKLNAGLPPR